MARLLKALEGIQNAFNSARFDGKQVSLADLIVLAGSAGVEKAAKNAGHEITVPFTRDAWMPHRIRPTSRPLPCSNPSRTAFALPQREYTVSAEALLVDKAQLLTLTAPEMTVLVGGMRVLKTNFGGAQHGVFTQRPEALTNDFFVNLLDMATEWSRSRKTRMSLKAAIAKTGALKWTGTRVDLVFGSTPNSAPWLKSTEVPTLGRSSSTTLSRPGIR